MPILTESMAPLVSSYSQSLRACLRSRDPDEVTLVAEAPLRKRMCSGGEREFGTQALKKTRVESRSGMQGELGDETLACGPGNRTKEEATEKRTSGGWESLELSLLERISRSLSVADLCRLTQVNKHYKEMCARDALWAWRATEKGIAKAVQYEDWRWNVKTAANGALHATPLDSATDVHFSGDVAIVDPFTLFFAGKSNRGRQAELRQVMQECSHGDLVLTYRGVQSAVLRTSCAISDDDSAFEVFRDGEELGADVTSSGAIAVVPRRLVLKLVEENGGAPENIGVAVVGVNGVLRRSLDGDFIIRHSESARGTPVEVPCSGATHYADVVCSTGGSWTEDSDSDDEEELTEEEMAEAIAEAASLTAPPRTAITSAPFAHCNAAGLVHAFTLSQVSMLS